MIPTYSFDLHYFFHATCLQNTFLLFDHDIISPLVHFLTTYGPDIDSNKLMSLIKLTIV